MNKLAILSASIAIVVISAVVTLGGVSAQSVNTTKFNIYDAEFRNDAAGNTRTHSESDFLRLGHYGQDGNTVEVCDNGATVDMWIYVHNGAPESLNGGRELNGEGVARNTTVQLTTDTNLNQVGDETAAGRQHTFTASIDSLNSESVQDTVTVTCADKEISLVYKGITEFKTNAPDQADHGQYTLNGDPVNGALVGYDGLVPGCWEYRSRVSVQFEVVAPEDKQDEDPPTPTDLPKTGGHLSLAMIVLGFTIATTGYQLVARRRQIKVQTTKAFGYR